MKESLKIFAGDLKNSFKDLLPIIIVVALFQGVIIQAVPDNLTSIVIGLDYRSRRSWHFLSVVLNWVSFPSVKAWL